MAELDSIFTVVGDFEVHIESVDYTRFRFLVNGLRIRPGLDDHFSVVICCCCVYA